MRFEISNSCGSSETLRSSHSLTSCSVSFGERGVGVIGGFSAFEGIRSSSWSCSSQPSIAAPVTPSSSEKQVSQIPRLGQNPKLFQQLLHAQKRLCRCCPETMTFRASSSLRNGFPIGPTTVLHVRLALPPRRGCSNCPSRKTRTSANLLTMNQLLRLRK